MAERRMFTKKITDSDAFVELSSAAQALYLHLNQGADDDGFTNQVQMAMFKAHASVDDLKVLIAKEFIITFENGVIVIKHWRMHNALRKDRYKPTDYQEELKQLGIKENGVYTLGCQVVAERLPQDRIVKDSTVKDSVNDGSEALPAKPPTPTRFIPPSVDEVRAYCTERGNGVDAERFVDYYTARGWLAGKSKMKDWKAAVRTWERNDREDRHGSTDTGEAAADVPERGQYGTWL